jgi:ABC-2 type transport system ATP-binding protein
MPAVALEDVTVSLGGRTILDHVSMVAASGRCCGLVGANGSGKTTLLRAILGLIPAESGCIRLFGSTAPPKAGRVGISLSARQCHPRRRAWVEILLRAEALGVDRREAEAWWEEMGIPDKAIRAGSLSLGQASRLAVICALIGRPELVVLDEPTVGLDFGSVQWLEEILQAYMSVGGTVLISSHDLQALEHVAHDLLVLANSRIAHSGSLEGLGIDQAHLIRLRSSDTSALLAALTEAELQFREFADGEVHVTGVTPTLLGRLLAARSIPLTAMVPERVTIESIVQKWTASAA